MSDWNGEGLPPAGCKCLYREKSLNDYAWRECEVKFTGEHTVVFVDEIGHERVNGRPDPYYQIEFKPNTVDPRRAVLEKVFNGGISAYIATGATGSEAFEDAKEQLIKFAIEKLDNLPPF